VIYLYLCVSDSKKRSWCSFLFRIVHLQGVGLWSDIPRKNKRAGQSFVLLSLYTYGTYHCLAGWFSFMTPYRYTALFWLDSLLLLYLLFPLYIQKRSMFPVTYTKPYMVCCSHTSCSSSRCCQGRVYVLLTSTSHPILRCSHGFSLGNTTYHTTPHLTSPRLTSHNHNATQRNANHTSSHITTSTHHPTSKYTSHPRLRMTSHPPQRTT